MGNIRLAVRVVSLTAALLTAVALHLLWHAAGRRSSWPQRFLVWAMWIIGVRAEIRGEALTRDAVLLANHLSPVDIPVLGGTAGCAFVAKGELAHAPIVGWLARINCTVFVARGDRLAVAQQVEQLRTALAARRPIAIFAEGGTGDGVTITPFKPALLAALDPAPVGLRVQPVRIDYGPATADLVWPDEEPGPAYARRILSRRAPIPVTLSFLAPFAPAEFPGRKAMAAEAWRRVAAAG